MTIRLHVALQVKNILITEPAKTQWLYKFMRNESLNKK